VVNGINALRDAVDGEDRELGALVVITRVVAKRAFQSVLETAGMLCVGTNVAFEHDFGKGGHTQFTAQRLDQFGAAAAQQTGKLVFTQTVGHGCHSAQNRGRVSPQRDTHRVGLAGVLLGVVPEVERAAAVRQPAHDDLVAGQHLLAVNTEVLPRLVRTFRDDQAPGDERRHVARPAVLDGQLGQINVCAFPHQLLAGRAAQFFGSHAPQRFDQAAHAHQLLEALGRFGLLEAGQHMAKLAQF